MQPLSIPKYLRQYLRPKRLAILEAGLIGLVAALAAVSLKQGVGWLGGVRMLEAHILPVWLILPSFGLALGVIAGWLVEQVAPSTSGSGIPQVKAVLAKVPLPLNLRVAFVKLIGGILALGSGLPLGREGPTVQVGAALAAQLSRWFPTSPDHRRQLIAAGAGAGLAAAFNAPIAGVLFVVEELLQDVSGLTLGTAILASFIGATVSESLGDYGLRFLGGQNLDFIGELGAPPANFSLIEIPMYVALGVFAGLLGLLFNRGILASLTFYSRILGWRLPWRIGLAGLIIGLSLSCLPIYFRDNAGLRHLIVTGQAGPSIAALALITQFILTIVAYGSGAPGGLFAPTLTLGAALGSLMGSLAHTSLGIDWPTTYALAGMGAFFAAVARVPITSIVIVFEMTRDFQLVLPLMISCVIAYLVAEKLFPGSLYDHLLEWSGIHLQAEVPTHGGLTLITAAEVMQRRVETLSVKLSVEEAIQAFSRSPHRGFPVVNQGHLVGIVTQTDLEKIKTLNLSGTTPLTAIMTPQPIAVSPTDTLNEVLYLLTRYQLSRLPVVEGRKLVGIITRSDIIRAESESLTGKTAGPTASPSFVVYQTRSPQTGQGRLLVPLANPNTAPVLLHLAAVIAKQRHYELEAMQVIRVSRHRPPAETPVRTTKARRLLQTATKIAKEYNVPVHLQIRVAHDTAQAILETVQDRHIDLVMMGWKGRSSTPGRIFGDVVDTVIRQATAEVILVKWFEPPPPEPATSQTTSCPLPVFNRWLIPVAGGPNSQQALQLLPALISLSAEPVVTLCQVIDANDATPDTTALEQAHESLTQLSCPVSATPVTAHSVAEGVAEIVKNEHCDTVILGASREGFLKQVIQGNIPETIARKCECTVILVRF